MFDIETKKMEMDRQKMFRKTFTLTDFQISRLNQLSELDGQDPMKHIRKAVDEYIKNQKFDFNPPKESEIFAEIKKRYDDPDIARAIWISGVVDQYEFSALIFNGPSKSGIDKGRISKLSIWDPVVKENTNNFLGSCIMNYDRGWDIRPGKVAQPFYEKVKSLIEQFLDQSRQTK